MKVAKKTIKSIVNEFQSKLTGIYDEGEINAFINLVFEHCFNLPPHVVKYNSASEVNNDIYLNIQYIIEELKKGVPVQYLLSHTCFYGLDIKLNEFVFIPRQETEELVDWLIKSHKDFRGNILDIGTGSGCIAISLKHAFPEAKVSAMDISPNAIEVAMENATQYNLHIEFFRSDILSYNDNIPDRKFNIIVSNPPYVLDSQKKYMFRNVLDHEPRDAIFVPDDDPLLFYKAIANYGLLTLEENGELYFEINEVLGKETMELLSSIGYCKLELRQDINGKNRMIHAIRP